MAGKIAITRLFKERMTREKRRDEWLNMLAKFRESPKEGESFIRSAMLAMGYGGAARERELAEEWENTKHLGNIARNIKKQKDELIEERAAGNFADAIASLPDKAPIAEELDWIRAHPAMGRKLRQKDPNRLVRITKADVLYPGHGRAPSKAAVWNLQTWAQRPEKFAEMLLTETRKISSAQKDKEISLDMDLKVVEKMLSEMGGSDE